MGTTVTYSEWINARHFGVYKKYSNCVYATYFRSTIIDRYKILQAKLSMRAASDTDHLLFQALGAMKGNQLKRGRSCRPSIQLASWETSLIYTKVINGFWFHQNCPSFIKWLLHWIEYIGSFLEAQSWRYNNQFYENIIIFTDIEAITSSFCLRCLWYLQMTHVCLILLKSFV
jgi:hypothetical protein